MVGSVIWTTKTDMGLLKPLDQKMNAEIIKELAVARITVKMKEYTEKRYGHILRMTEDRTPI